MKKKEGSKCSMEGWGWRCVPAGLVCLLVLAQQFGVLEAQMTEAEIAKMKEFIAAHKGEFTYEQFEKWYEQKLSDENSTEILFSRLFPICVTLNQINDSTRVRKESHIYKFINIIHSLELGKQRLRSYRFNETIHYQPKNTKFIKSVHASRINTPEPDMVNLRQWVHLTVKTEPIEGLYIQPIVGPFGLPLGEFSLEFPCQDFEKSKDLDKVGQLVYCAYRPRTSIVHPNVYVGYSGNKREEWHVHFRWFDISCMETPYLQFILVAVKTFQNWKGGSPDIYVHFLPQLSEIFLNTKFDSYDGTPYPYYPEWEDKMYCNLESQDAYFKAYGRTEKSSRKGGDPAWAASVWEPTPLLTRIQNNEDYDFCLMADSNSTEELSMTQRDEKYFECSPGPFKCDSSYASKSGVDVVIQQRQEWLHNETLEANCSLCVSPPCDPYFKEDFDGKCPLPGKTDENFNLSEEVKILEKLDIITRGRNHGASASVAFLFFIPMANYMARFCKDMGGKWVFGNGPWLFLHCAFALIAIVLCGDSAGNIFPNFSAHRVQHELCTNENELNYTVGSDEYEDCMKDVVLLTAHNVLGIFTLLLLLLSLSTAFVRPASNRLRTIIDAMHSHIGYLTWIMGIITIFVGVKNSHCTGGLYLTGMAFGVPLMFTVAAVILDIVEDRKLRIIPGRRQYPVYEQIELEKRGPLDLIKWVVFGVYAAIMVIVMCLIIANTYIIEQSGDDAFSKVSSTKDKDNVFNEMHGLFGECMPPNTNVKKIEQN